MATSRLAIGLANKMKKILQNFRGDRTHDLLRRSPTPQTTTPRNRYRNRFELLGDKLVFQYKHNPDNRVLHLSVMLSNNSMSASPDSGVLCIFGAIGSLIGSLHFGPQSKGIQFQRDTMKHYIFIILFFNNFSQSKVADIVVCVLPINND